MSYFGNQNRFKKKKNKEKKQIYDKFREFKE